MELIKKEKIAVISYDSISSQLIDLIYEKPEFKGHYDHRHTEFIVSIDQLQTLYLKLCRENNELYLELADITTTADDADWIRITKEE